MAQAQHPHPPPQINLQGILNRAENDVQTILDYEGPLVDLLEEEPVKGEIYTQLLQQNSLTPLTNLSVDTLINLFQTCNL